MLHRSTLVALVALASLVSLLLFAAPAHAAVASDLITSLPGFGATPTPQYSGFIAADAASTVYLHYWFVLASTNSSTAPVVLWLNGGPGCSSLDGYLYEHGPLHFNGSRTSSGLPLLAENPYAWTSIANVLYLEAPAGVGFSYATNGSTTTNDEITSQNNYQFLLNFFKAYPEFASNEFFITGESYAGIYVPTLVDRVRLGNAAGNANINLVGFAVGNGCWGNAVGTCALYGPFDSVNNGLEIQLNFLFGHALYSQDTNDAIVQYCGNLTNPNPTSDCENAIDAAQTEGGDYNIYDIYDVCPSPVSSRMRAPNGFYANRNPVTAAMNKRFNSRRLAADPAGCIGSDYASDWLDDSTVRAALHVTQSPTTSWSICADIQYEKTVQSLLPLYPTLIAKYRTLIYSGDVDACVPFNGSEEWTRGLGYNVTDAWRPWTINDQVAGYVVTYAENGFSFLTVKGAGHMVPQYQPEAGFVFFQRFLTNSGY